MTFFNVTLQQLYAAMIPSAPTIIGTLYRNKSIFMNWSHPTNEAIEHFTISYSCIVLECMGSPDCSGLNNVTNTRMNYTIEEVEEDSNYTITIIAVNRNGRTMSAPHTITTNTER